MFQSLRSFCVCVDLVYMSLIGLIKFDYNQLIFIKKKSIFPL